MPFKFKSNDRVQLKSGSPTMVVVGHAVSYTPGGKVPITDKYECSWFDGKKSQQAIFREEDIKLIESRR
jgi:uncharacterized protein YodC (DUF2158 family)